MGEAREKSAALEGRRVSAMMDRKMKWCRHIFNDNYDNQWRYNPPGSGTWFLCNELRIKFCPWCGKKKPVRPKRRPSRSES